MPTSTKHPGDTPNPPLPPHLMAVCERYKGAWQAAALGAPVPRVDDFLADASPEELPVLRAELKLLDSWVRDLLPVWGVPPSRLSDGGNGLPTTVHRAPDSPPTGSREFDFEVTTDHTPGSRETAEFTPLSANPTKTGPDGAGVSPERVDVPGYQILGTLGQGGMGVVFKARQVKADRVVALKLMLRAEYASPAALARFGTEARAVARMQHPNIVQVFEVGEAGGSPFFSLEYVDGGSLADIGKAELLPPRRVAELVEAISRAVHYAHTQGIVHRDLKPANVLLTRDGTPKVADFGLAKRLEDAEDGLTRDGAVMGTPSYMSPEQAFGNLRVVGPRSDVYSLGAILYDLLAGRPPFKGSTTFETLELVRHREPVPPTQFRPGTPHDLETICLKCLFKEPDRRYQTAEALADDLRRYLNGEPILARPVSAVERTVRWSRRNKAVAGLLATSFGLLLALAVGAVWYAVDMRAKNKTISDEKARVVTQRDQYRETVQRFATDAPALIDEAQVGSATKEEFLKFLAGMLSEVDTNVDDQGITRRGVQATLNTEGDLALSRRNFALAQKKYEESKAISEEQLRDPRGEADRLRGNLAMTLGKLAQLEKTRPGGDPAKVADYYRQALELQTAVLTAPETAAIPPDEARVWIGRTHTDLAEFLRTRRDFPAARTHSTRAIDVFKAIVVENLPPRQQEQCQLGHAMAWLEDGRTAFKLDDVTRGHAGFTKAMELYDAATAKNPTSTRIRLLAAVPPAEYGDLVLVKFNDAAKARALFDKSLAYLRPVAVTPETARLDRRLALDFYRKAMTHLEAGDEANARKYFERAWGILEGAFQGVNEEWERATDPAEKSLITAEQNTIRINLMVYRARTKRVDGPAGALDIANRIRAAFTKLGPTHPQYTQTREAFLQAGVTYGICAEFPTVATAGVTGTAMQTATAVKLLRDPDARRATLRDLAFACLHEAVARGFNDLEFLTSDPDLDPLRDDPRLQEVIRAADAKK